MFKRFLTLLHTRRTVIWLAITLLIMLFSAAARLQTPAHPAEDAAMLMRYADHLAQGNGIVWNIDEKPVDGATDFLFMVLLAALHALGISLETAVISLGIGAQLLTMLIVFHTVSRIEPGSPQMAALSVLLLAVGPGTAYTAAYFGTTFFALAGALAWHLAVRLSHVAQPPRHLTLSFAAACLLAGLIRPEGVFLAGFILLGLLVRRQGRGARLILRDVMLIFGGLGLAYFIWRWVYFGYPLPNPFYKKGAGLLHPQALTAALRNFLELNQPYAWVALTALAAILVRWVPSLRSSRIEWAINPRKARLTLWLGAAATGLALAIGLLRRSQPQPGMILGLYSQQYFTILFFAALAAAGILMLAISAPRWLPQKVRLPFISSQLTASSRTRALNAAFVLIPALGFTLIWVLLSNEMNYLGRFQYSLTVIMMMGGPLLWAQVAPMLQPYPLASKFSRAALAFILFGGVALTIRQANTPVYADGRYDAALVLRQFANHGYTIATSEAGLLPFYSTWRAVDTWGLNDQWITHTGEITEAYLDRYRPELIVFHANLHFTEKAPRTAWDWMARRLWQYARARQYVLAAAFGSDQDDYHYYYVRADFPDASAIIQHLQHMDYAWYENGKLATNHAVTMLQKWEAEPLKP